MRSWLGNPAWLPRGYTQDFRQSGLVDEQSCLWRNNETARHSAGFGSASKGSGHVRDQPCRRHRSQPPPGTHAASADLALERRPVRAPGAGEVVVHNIVTSVDPYQLRMLRGSPEVTAVAISGRAVTPARATPGRTSPRPWGADNSVES